VTGVKPSVPDNESTPVGRTATQLKQASTFCCAIIHFGHVIQSLM
jgi:hypothetical protein